MAGTKVYHGQKNLPHVWYRQTMLDHVFKQWVKTAVNDLNNPNDPARPWLIVILDHGHKLANSKP